MCAVLLVFIDRDISVSLPKDRRQVFKLFGWWISG